MSWYFEIKGIYKVLKKRLWQGSDKKKSNVYYTGIILEGLDALNQSVHLMNKNCFQKK